MMAEQAKAEHFIGYNAYLDGDIESALIHYNKAIELDSLNISFYMSKAELLFEKKQFEEVVVLCEKAVRISSQTPVDKKMTMRIKK
uniref:TPR_REGION domain-containing protein n=1 Tax=Caenorhabditis tropicalis TaxID=1561998 RepID=A0A1I7V218_9PELO